MLCGRATRVSSEPSIISLLTLALPLVEENVWGHSPLCCCRSLRSGLRLAVVVEGLPVAIWPNGAAGVVAGASGAGVLDDG